jgi:hypothetical protein
MPFPFSHPAAVLPFKNLSWFSLSALVVGSLTPDFEYFFRLKLHGRYGHTLEGIFLLDIPMGLLILFVFHLVVKRPLVQHLPNYFQARLHQLVSVDYWNYAKANSINVILSLLIGICTHVLWDSFTHANTLIVDTLPFLDKVIEVPILKRVPVFRILQHTSTIIGSVFVVWVFHHLPQSKEAGHWQFKSFYFWIMVFSLALILFEIRRRMEFEYYGDVITVLIASLLFGLVGGSFLWSHVISRKSSN